MPGGAEALVHWRGLIEELALTGAIEPLVAFDLDLANMFGSIEWPAIRNAIAKHFPEAEAWVQWEHAAVEEIELPSGGVAYGDRGAGQGDVFGPTKASLALGEAVTHARPGMALESNGTTGDRIGASDEWFMDDGQAFVKPHVASNWLRKMDTAIESFGGRREIGRESKSVARLLCPPGRVREFDGWSSGYIESTCKVRQASSPPKVLGALVGDQAVTTEHFRSTCSKVTKSREGIASLDNAQCELVLQRRCFDVSKVSYLLRLNGDRVDVAALEEFDGALRGATEDALRGKLRDEGWVQSTLGVDAGGLGLREASAVALAAFVASRVSSRPLVMEMCRHMAAEAMVDVDECMTMYDDRTRNALRRFLEDLPEGVRDDAAVQVEAA